MDRQQEFVLRTIEERDIRFVRLWFTDVLGHLKSVAVAPAELEGAFSEGIGFDGSAHRGLRPGLRGRHARAKPDPVDVPGAALARRQPRARRGCSATSLLPDGSRPLRRLRARAQARAGQGGRPRVHLLHPPRDRVLPVRAADVRSTAPVPVDHGGYFDHVPHGTGHDFRRAAITMLESMGISVEFSHHEGGPGQNEIDLRYADALSHRRQHHDLPHGDQGGRARAGRLRDVHAQAVRRAPRLGHAHAPVAVRGRPQRVLRGRRAVPALPRSAGSSSPACCGTPPRSPRSPTSGSTPTSGSGAAARRRRTSAGGTTTARALVRVPMYKPSKGQSTRVEVRSLDSACNPYLAFAVMLARRAQGHRGGLRAARRRPRTTSGR